MWPHVFILILAGGSNTLFFVFLVGVGGGGELMGLRVCHNTCEFTVVTIVCLTNQRAES